MSMPSASLFIIILRPTPYLFLYVWRHGQNGCVCSRLDYSNSVLFGTTQKNISKLQKAHNLIAQVVTSPPQSCSSRTLLQQLDWLPIKHCIDFKIANSILFILPNQLTYVHPSMPVIPRVPSDSPRLMSSLLRLSAHHLALADSALQPLKSGTLSLSLSLHTCTSPDTFRRHLKTHYCQ